jgi:lipopolysaccharide biosynthesis protein
MKTLCYFSSYFESDEIPYYVRFYLDELCLQCEQVIFITNEKKLSASSQLFLENKKIELLPVKNEGYDFGMWTKALAVYPPDAYDRLILANDSCILFRSLGKALKTMEEQKWEYAGLLDSNEISYHIQSYFLVIRQNAFPVIKAYLEQQDFAHSMQDAIHRFEVGLSAAMIQHQHTIGAVFSRKDAGVIRNESYAGIAELIREGFPVIKRKILYDSFSRKERISLIRAGIELVPGDYMNQIKVISKEEQTSFDVEKLYKEIGETFYPLRWGWDKLYARIYQSIRKRIK